MNRNQNLKTNLEPCKVGNYSMEIIFVNEPLGDF